MVRTCRWTSTYGTRIPSGRFASGTRGPTAGGRRYGAPRTGCATASCSAARKGRSGSTSRRIQPSTIPSDVEWPREDPRTDFSFMLDPSEELFYYSLWDDASVRGTGKRAHVAGRDAVEVQVETVSWGYPPTIFHDFHAPEGTTDHLLLVDAEMGTILRAAARLEGREFYVAEVTEISYDEKFPEDTFRLDLPGEEFKRVEV